jgi:hypothetical protein
MASKKKIYAYVDETGQDTRGEFLIIAVIVIVGDRTKLRYDLQEIEKQSKKSKLKWTNSTQPQHEGYIRRIAENKGFKGSCFYSVYERINYSRPKTFAELTVSATAVAINSVVKKNYKATVTIDGLNSSLYPSYAAGLRSHGIKTHKVRGIRDQADEFIRLADAIAGLTRDVRDGKGWAIKLYNKTKRRGVIKKSNKKP